jgi:1-phosphofructokinase family hexose kinase
MFDRVITVSVNPAMDVTLWVQTMNFSEPNATTREETYAGGKAVNIARVLSALQMPCKLLGICGEDNSQQFFRLLRQDAVDFEYLQNEGAIRENLTLVVPNGRVLKVNRTGCAVSKEAMERLREKLLQEIASGDQVLLVFAGRLPPNLTRESYREFIRSFAQDNVRFAIDVAAFTLEDIRLLRPLAIKPNLLELRQMSGVDLRTEQSIVKLSKTLTPFVSHILVSLGEKGLIYTNEKASFRLVTPSVTVRSTVGAGDTTLAGFLYGLQREMEPLDAVRFAVAAGTASVTLDGTDVIDLPLVAKIYPAVIAKPMR